MDIYISASSIGYLFATLVTLVTGLKLRSSYQHSRSEETRLLYIYVFFHVPFMFLYGIPGFFFHDDPVILGWFNVLANWILGIALAYNFRLGYYIHKPGKDYRIPFYILLFFGAVIVPIINIVYFPLPTFDRFTLELWNYHPVLWLVTGVYFTLLYYYLAFAILSRFRKEGGRKIIAYTLASAFVVGGTGGGLVTYAHTTGVAFVGYILMFFGGYFVFNTLFLNNRQK